MRLRLWILALDALDAVGLSRSRLYLWALERALSTPSTRGDR